MQDVVQTQENIPVQNMMQRSSVGLHVNQGAVAVEMERAIAEVKGQLYLAKSFPRDLASIHAEAMESASHLSMAMQAFYSVPNRGAGLSIKAAEELARIAGNFQYGHRELSRSEGKSEVEVYARDMEKNNYSTRQITVLHVIDTKNGPRTLKDQADIDNRIANVASKQVRGRILALLPKWLVRDFEDRCKQTLAGESVEPVSSRVRKMTQAFTKYGVTPKHLEDYLGHKLDDTTLDDLTNLIGIFNAIKEGAKVSEYFGVKEQEPVVENPVAAKLNSKAKSSSGNTAPQEPKNSNPEQKNGNPVQAQAEAVVNNPPIESEPPVPQAAPDDLF